MELQTPDWKCQIREQLGGQNVTDSGEILRTRADKTIAEMRQGGSEHNGEAPPEAWEQTEHVPAPDGSGEVDSPC